MVFRTNDVNAENSLKLDEIDAALRVENVLVVSTTPGLTQFGSIKDAVDSITTNSVSNPFLVEVGPGVFIEDTITMKPYVFVEGAGEDLTIIEVDATSKDVIHAADYSVLRRCLLTGATDSGKAAIRYASTTSTATTWSLVEDVRFGNNDILIINEPVGVPAIILCNNIKFGSVYQYNTGFLAVSSGGGIGRIQIRDSTSTGGHTAPYPDPFAQASGTGSEIIFNGLQCNTGGLSTTTCLKIRDGGQLRAAGCNIKGWGKGIWAENVGVAPTMRVLATILESCTEDVVVDHPGTTGTFFGVAEQAKVMIDSSSSVEVLHQDPATGNLIVTGTINAAAKHEDLVNISTLITEGSTMGPMEGGELSDGGGFVVNIGEGFGYLNEAATDILRRFDWSSTSVVIPANSERYVYFNDSGILSLSASLPNSTNAIVLGRAVTHSTGIELIDASPVISHHTSNLFDNFHRFALGPIYASGSIVTENITTNRHLDVTAGRYFFSPNDFTPSGGTDITFTSYYQDGLGDWIRTSTQTVDNVFYDDSSGTLAALTVGYYAKHVLYVVGEGALERYFLVYGQEQFLALTLAEQGNVPTPPSYFTDGVTQIAAIIVKEGQSTIEEIIDIRPVIGFKAGNVSATTFHGNLLGLSNDDHPQYLLVDGSRAMSGSLDMGANNVTNVNLVDGVDVSAHASRHLPTGADPITTGTPVTVGLVNAPGIANELIRSDHIHAHGDQPGGSLHAVATTSVAGFMSPTDKTKLDGLFGRMWLQFGKTSTTGSGSFLNTAGGVVSSSNGYRVPRACIVTAISMQNDNSNTFDIEVVDETNTLLATLTISPAAEGGQVTGLSVAVAAGKELRVRNKTGSNNLSNAVVIVEVTLS